MNFDCSIFVEKNGKAKILCGKFNNNLISGSPGFPGSLLEYVEQPPPPYQPAILLANLPENAMQEHQYDEINILMQQQQQYPADIINPNGYNSTFHFNEGLQGRTTPPTSRPPVPGRSTPPQIPDRSNANYDVVRRESPHRLNNMSPLATTMSPQSHLSTPPWGQNSDI